MGHYSLWLIPSGEQERRLAETIGRLSRESGGPLFEPHLTLLGGIGGAEDLAVAATGRLAAALRPIVLQFCAIEFGNEPYRCLYLRVAENDHLTAAQREAMRLFGRTVDPSFMPHLSLFYGTLARERRAAIAATLEEWRSAFCRAARLHLVATGGGPPPWRVVREHALTDAHPGS